VGPVAGRTRQTLHFEGLPKLRAYPSRPYRSEASLPQAERIGPPVLRLLVQSPKEPKEPKGPGAETGCEVVSASGKRRALRALCVLDFGDDRRGTRGRSMQVAVGTLVWDTRPDLGRPQSGAVSRHRATPEWRMR
jgi:hypothetical protein